MDQQFLPYLDRSSCPHTTDARSPARREHTEFAVRCESGAARVVDPSSLPCIRARGVDTCRSRELEVVRAAVGIAVERDAIAGVIDPEVGRQLASRMQSHAASGDSGFLDPQPGDEPEVRPTPLTHRRARPALQTGPRVSGAPMTRHPNDAGGIRRRPIRRRWYDQFGRRPIAHALRRDDCPVVDDGAASRSQPRSGERLGDCRCHVVSPDV